MSIVAGQSTLEEIAGLFNGKEVVHKIEAHAKAEILAQTLFIRSAVEHACYTISCPYMYSDLF